MGKKEKSIIKFGALLIGILVLILFCYNYFNKKLNTWSTSIDGAGTYSSIRSVDLNKDGVLDIVIGGGAKEYQPCEYGVMAFDGASGALIWKVPSRNQIVGSAIFKDIDADGVDDVFIGGRTAQLLAVNGKTGKKIWEYLPDYPDMDKVNDTTLLNFFNAQWIPDVDNDDLDDILVPFGGFVNAGPEEFNRPAGSLKVISSKTGKELANALMPDGKETYFSPVVYDFDNDGELSVVFGSGGETINGGLFIANLSDVLSNDLSHALKLADGMGKGFISTPTLVDITNDNVPDIVTISFNGRMMAFNGATLKLIWEIKPDENLETYSSVAPIHANDDGILDFFGVFGVGTWPNIKKSLEVVIDGSTGKEIKRYNIGTFQYASPIVYDMTQDGTDDIILSINNRSQGMFGNDLLEGEAEKYRFSTEIFVIDIKNNEKFGFGDILDGTNLASTPLITDLDDDGNIDFISCRMGDAFDFFAFDNLIIQRQEFKLKVKNHIPWGEYFGSDHDAIYKTKK